MRRARSSRVVSLHRGALRSAGNRRIDSPRATKSASTEHRVCARYASFRAHDEGELVPRCKLSVWAAPS